MLGARPVFLYTSGTLPHTDYTDPVQVRSAYDVVSLPAYAGA
jgi:hypothetical protein